MGLNLDEQKAVDRFRKEVVEPSKTKLVILDFWAEWCGPCKALAPTLEKVAAEYADKGVVLVKLNVDEEGFIASQFQVRSIPTVYAMFQGQPVADLTNARTESQLKELLDQLLASLPVEGGDADQKQDLDQFVTMAEEALAAGDAERALGVFAQVVDMQPDFLPAQSGLIRTLIALEETAAAQQAFDALPEEMKADPSMAQVRSALELKQDAPEDGELTALRTAAQAAPEDMDKQFEFASAAFASGARDEAADTLLSMISADAAWNEGAAKAKLLQIFEAVGLEDPWVSATRRKLSLILFG